MDEKILKQLEIMNANLEIIAETLTLLAPCVTAVGWGDGAQRVIAVGVKEVE